MPDDIEFPDPGLETPLYKAVKSGNDNIVHLLLEKGASVDYSDFPWLTPL